MCYRPHNEVLPGPIGEDTEDIAKKRKKLQEDLSDLPAPVRDALVTFEETWSTFVKGKPLGRFPTELEGALQSVGQVAMANHPKGFLSNDIIEILQSITGFSSATLKPRIRKGSSEPGHVAGTSEKTGSSIASPTHAEAVAYLQSLGGEFSPVLDLPLEETRSSELQKLMEKHIEELSTIVKAFAASFSEPPKRSPWNDAIKNKIKLLFAINDSIVPPPVNASTLRTHLLSLWPPEWEVKDTQIKPLTRYFKPPTTKSAEPDGTPTKTA